MTHTELVKALAKSGEDISANISADTADLWHHGTGIATEAGEILDAVKRVAIYGKAADRENFVEELGDLEFYMEGLRQNLGITRDETIEHNIAKLSRRYASLGYSDAQALARADKVS